VITLKLEKQGESITFFGQGDHTASSVEFEVTMAPGASGPESHRHPRQSERFDVVSGRLVATVEGEEKSLGAGESVTVAAGQAHTFANGSETEPLVFRTVVAPALHFQWFLTEGAKSAIRGGGSWKDMPILYAAHLLHEMGDEYRIAGMPDFLQDVIFGALARVAVLLGRTREIAPRLATPADPVAIRLRPG
jgi:mannose-6-phosphate isomerase-like protein (cupin superfamily)